MHGSNQSPYFMGFFPKLLNCNVCTFGGLTYDFYDVFILIFFFVILGYKMFKGKKNKHNVLSNSNIKWLGINILSSL